MSDFWTDTEVRRALGLGPEGQGAGEGKGRTGEGGERGGVAFAGISTDTRTIAEGALFVALEGERFDAHEFLGQAAAAGARGAVVARVPEDAPDGLVYYRVADTLEALGQLACHYRRSLDARLCAVVGSNGKTTTKELARATLGVRYRVHATTGNLNNLIGAPLTVLAAPRDAEVLVVEAGTNAPGEIARLGEILEPDAVIVTSIAEEHLEGLGDLAGVLEEETSILDALPSDGVAIVADDPPELPLRARERAPRVRVAGHGEGADEALRAEDVRLDDEGRPAFRWRGNEVRLNVRGRIHVRNALLALGLAEEWGVEPAAAAAALAEASVPSMRGEVHRYGDLMVIADCYNANPASVEAAVELLASLPRRGGRVAVLGTMGELGPTSAALHRRTAEAVAEAGLDVIVATGDFVEAFGELAGRLGDRLIRVEDPEEAYGQLAVRLTGSETVLLKGSRSVALERLLPRFEDDWGPGAEVRVEADARRAGDAASAATGE